MLIILVFYLKFFYQTLVFRFIKLKLVRFGIIYFVVKFIQVRLECGVLDLQVIVVKLNNISIMIMQGCL